MRFLTLMVAVAVLFGVLSPQAATVALEDGRTLKGRVIVRGDILTLVIEKSNDSHLYQFPISQVVRITGDDPNSPNIVSRRTALRAEDSRRSEPLTELERGLEVKRLAARRGWVQVEGWNEEVRGYILDTELAPEVRFSVEERAMVKARLGVVDPPPPPRETQSTRSQQARSPGGKSEEESVAEQTAEPGQQSDSSVTE